VSGRTAAEIELLLGSESLAEGSTWPDEQRSNPDTFWQETASPWHYVTLPEGRTIDQLIHPPEGDAASALERFRAILRDPEANQKDKARALRFAVHIIADLHQPLHVGDGTDRGGNDVKVMWFDQPNNLHWVWDEGLILRQQLSFTEYADRLDRRIEPGLTVAWWDARPDTWMAESAALRPQIYPQGETARGPVEGAGTEEDPFILSWDYAWRWNESMEERLAQSGIRTAAWLDETFAR
jgi:hypothetical protein